jgi:hypothetical protein
MPVALQQPADVSLYVPEGTDSDGLTLYHCARGTNSVESFHCWMNEMYSPLGQGWQLMDSTHVLLRHSWNMAASEKHRPNFPKVGHSFHWILDKIQLYTKAIYGRARYSWWRQSLSDKYVSTESFGIIPLSLGTQGASLNKDDFDGEAKNLEYLCRRMLSSCPYLPVITREEKQLFKDNYGNYFAGRSANRRGFDYLKMSTDWNSGSLKYKNDATFVKPSFRSRVFFKTESQIESYFKTYRKIANSIALQLSVKGSTSSFKQFLDQTLNNPFYVADGPVVPLDADITLIMPEETMLDFESEDEYLRDISISRGVPVDDNGSIVNAHLSTTNSSNPPSMHPVTLVSPRGIHGVVYDFNNHTIQRNTLPNKRKATGTDRPPRTCKNCKQTTCPGRIVFIARSEKRRGKEVYF